MRGSVLAVSPRLPMRPQVIPQRFPTVQRPILAVNVRSPAGRIPAANGRIPAVVAKPAQIRPRGSAGLLTSPYLQEQAAVHEDGGAYGEEQEDSEIQPSDEQEDDNLLHEASDPEPELELDQDSEIAEYPDDLSESSLQDNGLEPVEMHDLGDEDLDDEDPDASLEKEAEDLPESAMTCGKWLLQQNEFAELPQLPRGQIYARSQTNPDHIYIWDMRCGESRAPAESV